MKYLFDVGALRPLDTKAFVDFCMFEKGNSSLCIFESDTLAFVCLKRDTWALYNWEEHFSLYIFERDTVSWIYLILKGTLKPL